MNQTEARAAVEMALGEVAPDVDREELESGARLRQDLELDSLDFLGLMETIARETGGTVPEADYPQVATVGTLIDYVAAHADDGQS